jgi:hypothetical protein
MLNWVGRTACPNKAGGYAGGSLATGRVFQASQVSAEGLDKECPTMRGQIGLLRLSPTSLGEHTSKSKPCPLCWVLGMRLTTSSWKMIMLSSPQKDAGVIIGKDSANKERI